MKHMKPVLFLFLIVLIFAGCQRDLGLDGPSGTYLSLNLNLPESGSSDGARFIHSDADELTVSLTYPGENPIVAEFDFSSSSDNSILVEDLEPGTDVLLEVSVGLADSDVVLSSASTTLDIVKGVNSPAALTLEALTYTIHGTLYDEYGVVDNESVYSFTKDGEDLEISSDGKFSFELSTEDISVDDYLIFSVSLFEMPTYEMARSPETLIQNANDFDLVAKPEILLDFTVKCEQYVLPGTSYEIWQGYVNDGVMVKSGNADAEGHIFYQNTDYSYSGEHELLISYNDTFIDKQPYYSSAPGAVVDDVVMEPYAIFTGYNTDYGQFCIYRMNKSNTDTFLLSDTVMESTMSMANSCVDYQNGKIYIWTRNGMYDYYLIIIDEWESEVPTYSVTVLNSGFSGTYSNDYTVQQMLLLDSGNILFVATQGAFIFDKVTKKVITTWENSSDNAIVLNGAYQDSDGKVYVLGVDRSGSTPSEQKIYELLDGGNAQYSEYASLSSYNSFDESGIISSDGEIYENDFSSLLGLYSWDSKMVSVKVQDNFPSYTYAAGEVLLFNPSSSSWSQSGNPVSQDETVTDLLMLLPVGVLPDNKFYFREEDNDEWNIYRLENAENPTIQLYQKFTDPSGAPDSGSFKYYYNEGIILE